MSQAHYGRAVPTALRRFRKLDCERFDYTSAGSRGAETSEHLREFFWAQCARAQNGGKRSVGNALKNESFFKLFGNQSWYAKLLEKVAVVDSTKINIGSSSNEVTADLGHDSVSIESDGLNVCGNANTSGELEESERLFSSSADIDKASAESENKQNAATTSETTATSFETGGKILLPDELPAGMQLVVLLTKLKHIESVDSWLSVRQALEHVMSEQKLEVKIEGDLHMYHQY